MERTGSHDVQQRLSTEVEGVGVEGARQDKLVAGNGTDVGGGGVGGNALPGDDGGGDRGSSDGGGVGGAKHAGQSAVGGVPLVDIVAGVQLGDCVLDLHELLGFRVHAFLLGGGGDKGVGN